MNADLAALKQAMALIGIQSNDKVIIDSDETGWHIKAIDPSHVSFSKVRIPADTFTDYEPWGIFSVDLSKLIKALKDKGDTPEISMDGGLFKVKGEGMTSRISLLTPPDDNSRAPELELPANTVLSTSQLRRMVKALDEQPSLRISLSDEGIHMESFDEMGAGCQLDIPADDCVAIAGNGRARYPCTMFQAFVSILPNNVDMDLGLGDNMPAVFRFSSAGVECMWMVAPWIGEDDE